MEKKQIEQAAKIWVGEIEDMSGMAGYNGFLKGAEWIQKESGKQWTDEDLLRFGGGVLDIVNTKPTKEIVKAMSEWLQYYKENRGK